MAVIVNWPSFLIRTPIPPCSWTTTALTRGCSVSLGYEKWAVGAHGPKNSRGHRNSVGTRHRYAFAIPKHYPLGTTRLLPICEVIFAPALGQKWLTPWPLLPSGYF